MGQCLRGKMAEVGLVPPAPAPAVADSEQAPEESVAVVEEAVPEAPALDVTPPADAAVDVDSVIAATFGLLRAEPDGSVVIAGSGRPGSKVQVFANGELLGTVEVESSGDWVFVPDAPLAPGGLEITLGEEGKDGTAEDSFIVVINEDKSSQPLVVASKPGEASEVLQGLVAPIAIASAPAETAQPVETPAAAAATQTPAADEPAAMAAATAETPAEPAEPEAASSMDVAALPEAFAAPEADTASASAATPADATPDSAPSAPEVAPANAEPAPTGEPAATADAPVTATEPADADVAAVDAVPATGNPGAAAADTQVATAETEAVEATEPATAAAAATIVADIPPTIDAIEIETDRTFFAGAGPDGGVIRLYVDDSHVADAVVEGGRWLVEAGPVLGKPSQRVRVDLLQPNSATVVGRAEVDFVVDVPAVDEPVAVAEAAAPEVATEPVASEPAAAPQAAAPEAAAPEAAAPVGTETAAAPADTPVTTAPAEPAQPAAQPEAVAEARGPAEPAATEAAPAQEPVAIAETPATPAEPAVPTMVAVSLGDPEAQRFASGKAIIRRGDNLWTIARRVYGEGLKYTTIYQANTGQIRDPDRIYPGQVFDLPQAGSGQ